jgi:putative transposase
MIPFSINSSARYYYCTDSIMGGRYVFKDETAFKMIIDSLDYCRREKGLLIHGYVIMPDHMHLLLSSQGTALSSIVRDYKRFTSKKLSGLLEANENTRLLEYFHKVAVHTSRGTDYTIWQRGDPPIQITSRSMFLQKVDAIHIHPVKCGFVDRPEQWKYSSARNYLMDDHSVMKVDLLL